MKKHWLQCGGKAKIKAFLLVEITPGNGEGREGILLNERRTRISSGILLLTCHAAVPSGAFKKFEVDSEDISESSLITWDFCVPPNPIAL